MGFQSETWKETRELIIAAWGEREREKKNSLTMQTQVEALFEFRGDWIINHVMQLKRGGINTSNVIITMNAW